MEVRIDFASPIGYEDIKWSRTTIESWFNVYHRVYDKRVRVPATMQQLLACLTDGHVGLLTSLVLGYLEPVLSSLLCLLPPSRLDVVIMHALVTHMDCMIHFLQKRKLLPKAKQLQQYRALLLLPANDKGYPPRSSSSSSSCSWPIIPSYGTLHRAGWLVLGHGENTGQYVLLSPLLETAIRRAPVAAAPPPPPTMNKDQEAKTSEKRPLKLDYMRRAKLQRSKAELAPPTAQNQRSSVNAKGDGRLETSPEKRRAPSEFEGQVLLTAKRARQHGVA
jgi:hypothetical protein